MNLTDMRALVRRDLHDEDSSTYRWVDNEIDRHIARAVKELSEALPREQKVVLATTPGSREISLSSLTDLVQVEAAEYPVGQYPPGYVRFMLWDSTLTLLGPDVPDGTNCCIYYGRLHILSSGSSTIPGPLEDLVALGAAGYAAIQQGGFSVNQVNPGGSGTPQNWEKWGEGRLSYFRAELKRLGKRNRVRGQAALHAPGPAGKPDRRQGALMSRGGKRPGSGARKGNLNNFKNGLQSRQAREAFAGTPEEWCTFLQRLKTNRMRLCAEMAVLLWRHK